MAKTGLSFVLGASLLAACNLNGGLSSQGPSDDAAVAAQDLGGSARDLSEPVGGPDLYDHDVDLARVCPVGTKPCGVGSANPPRPRCIPDGYCCTNSDCPAATQTCQVDGTCVCPRGQKACLKECIASTSCCTDDDCPSKVCHVDGQCAPPACNDGARNGAETDIDCGGGFCPKCLNGRTCAIAIDCRSNSCLGMKCVDGAFSATQYGGANGPIWVTTADLNGDGQPDLATANVTSNNASVLLGRGDGGFDAIGSVGAGLAPVMIVAGDLDANGRQDLVVANRGSYDITVLLGNGDGTFAPGVAYGVGAAPASAAFADLNGDGHLDVVVANSASNTVSVLLGDGNGKLAPPEDHRTDVDPRAVATGDLDADGRDDVVVACASSSRVSVLLNRSVAGKLALAAFASTVSQIGPVALALADFNGDKKLDAVVGSGGSEAFVGGGNGAFMPLGVQGNQPRTQLVAIDIDNDKILDLVTTSGVLLGRGNAAFGDPVPFPGFPSATSIAVADFTSLLKDGKLDVAIAQQGASTVVTLCGNGDGTFEDLDPKKCGSTTDLTLVKPRFVRLADLNGDGRDDVLMTSSAHPELWVQMAQLGGTLALPAVHGTCADPSSIAIGDFNEDHALDVIVGCASASDAILFTGSRGGALTPVVPVNGVPPAIQARNVTVAEAGDIDRDGHADLVYSDGAGVKVMFGRGDGTFRNNPVPMANGGGLASARTLQLLDWNGDGFPDIVSDDGTSITIALSRGADMNKTFLGFDDGAKVPLANGARPSAAWAADIDGDGAPDIVFSDNGNNATPRVQVVLNAKSGMGNLTFKPNPVSYLVSSSPIWLVMTDFNGDKLLDLATANSLDRSVSTLFGKKDGTFEKLLTHEVGVGPRMVATGDVNGDGKPDLVTANATANTITVLLNQL